VSENIEADVVIAGGSAAGLALALALARTFEGALSVVVADPIAFASAPAARGDARAFAITAGSRRMLATLGVWAELAAGAQPVEAIEITDSALRDGVRPVLLTYDNHLADGEVGTHIVEATALQRALLTLCKSAPGVRLDASEIEVADRDGARAAVRLADGRSVAASLVVAADGARSRLREAAGIKTVGAVYDQIGIVATVRHELPHHGCAVQHFLPGGPFAMLPLTDTRTCVTWTEAADEARRILALDDTDFLAELEQRFGGKRGTLSLDGPRQSWPLGVQLARGFVAPQLALVGDAAHTVHPIAGLGLNLAFRDVAALAEVIADAARLGQDIGSMITLERYERWRRADSALSAATFDGLNRLFSNDSRLLRTARDAGLGVVDRIAGVKQWLVAEAAGLTGEVPRLLKGDRP
jgi:2-octaprenyl-6-methoxyphenol hydroxylase